MFTTCFRQDVATDTVGLATTPPRNEVLLAQYLFNIVSGRDSVEDAYPSISGNVMMG